MELALLIDEFAVVLNVIVSDGIACRILIEK